MNVSIELDNTFGNIVYYLQISQIYTSAVAIIISIFIFIFFCKRNVYHDNFRVLIFGLIVSLITNNILILIHSIKSYQNEPFVEIQIVDEYISDKSLKGNIHVCDKYSPIPFPLMLIYVTTLIALSVERCAAMRLLGRYEKIQFCESMLAFLIPLWLFSTVLAGYDYISSRDIEEKKLFDFCHNTIVQNNFIDFSFPFIFSLSPLLIITWIFIKNYYNAKLKIAFNNDSIEDYLSTRFQMIENVRSNALLAIFSSLLLIIASLFTFGLSTIQNPTPKTISFFVEMTNILFSISTVIFYISMIQLTPSFTKKFIKYFVACMKFILSLFIARRYNCINMIKKV
ncbi:Hypothetical protein SRAE_X000223300 [Strongyloides ratti]|uniref:G-protein coupled receptors family 1 profile domain-containing protein n=1 Tax=Strongyloides ratti TaxID=34506 RepID=A0A090KZ31_STRRB|nr:Hypothetical protein SRAE_X000223300 [Strongyloides ratti]CEF60494.1 Hypothetical protein SRAE_X000223300 [Strongyloides ratti]